MVVSMYTAGCGVNPPLHLKPNWSQMLLVKWIASGKTQLDNGLHNMCELRAWHSLNSTGSQRNSQTVLRLSHVCTTSLLCSTLLPSPTLLPLSLTLLPLSLTQLPMLHNMAGHCSITVSPGKGHHGPFHWVSTVYQVLSWNELYVIGHNEMNYRQNTLIVGLDVASLRP